MNNKVLIVDDHQDIRRLIKYALIPEHFEVFEAGNGADALTMVHSIQPMLVLLDVMMPGGINGFQVLEAIRLDPALEKTRVIMLTARGQKQDYEQGKALGADEFLTKPFSPLKLQSVIQNLCSE